MKQIRAFFVFLVMHQASFAIFSALSNLSPESIKESPVQLVVKEVKAESIIFQANFKRSDHMTLFLVRSPKSIVENSRHFRDAIWEAPKITKEDTRVKFNVPDPIGISVMGSGEEVELKITSYKDHAHGWVEFEVKKSEIRQTYLYYDFTQMVMDGGYYYCLDLSEFVAE